MIDDVSKQNQIAIKVTLYNFLKDNLRIKEKERTTD